MSLHDFWSLLTSVDSDRIKAVATDHLWLSLAVCFVSGILTSFTPCVYPMIPITINIFGRLSRKEGAAAPKGFNIRTFFLAGVYVLGMCVTYSCMGLVAGLTGSLFGKLLQSSYMLGFLTLLFLTLALSQLGVFKISLPGGLQTKLSSLGDNESLLGILVMGMISGLIVSPCVGPVIAGILAFVFDTSNAFKGFLYFLSFSLGLGVLFLLIGGFSGALAALPRSGTWMTRVNRILASLMLIATAYYGFLWCKSVGIIQNAPAQTASASSVHWYSDENEALRVAKEKHLPLVIDFTAAWCEACHVLDKNVLSEPHVAEVLGGQFISLRIDVTDDNEANEAKRKHYGVMSLPTILFVSRDGAILENPRVHGVIPVEEFMKYLSTVTQ